MVTSGRKTFSEVQSEGSKCLIITLINRMTLVTMVTKRTKSRKSRLIFLTTVPVVSIPARSKQPIGNAIINMKAMVTFSFIVAPIPPDIVRHEYTFRKKVNTTPLIKTEWMNKSNNRLTTPSPSLQAAPSPSEPPVVVVSTLDDIRIDD